MKEGKKSGRRKEEREKRGNIERRRENGVKQKDDPIMMSQWPNVSQWEKLY